MEADCRDRDKKDRQPDTCIQDTEAVRSIQDTKTVRGMQDAEIKAGGIQQCKVQNVGHNMNM